MSIRFANKKCLFAKSTNRTTEYSLQKYGFRGFETRLHEFTWRTQNSGEYTGGLGEQWQKYDLLRNIGVEGSITLWRYHGEDSSMSAPDAILSHMDQVGVVNNGYGISGSGWTRLDRGVTYNDLHDWALPKVEAGLADTVWGADGFYSLGPGLVKGYRKNALIKGKVCLASIPAQKHTTLGNAYVCRESFEIAPGEAPVAPWLDTDRWYLFSAGGDFRSDFPWNVKSVNVAGGSIKRFFRLRQKLEGFCTVTGNAIPDWLDQSNLGPYEREVAIDADSGSMVVSGDNTGGVVLTTDFKAIGNVYPFYGGVFASVDFVPAEMMFPGRVNMERYAGYGGFLPALTSVGLSISERTIVQEFEDTADIQAILDGTYSYSIHGVDPFSLLHAQMISKGPGLGAELKWYWRRYRVRVTTELLDENTKESVEQRCISRLATAPMGNANRGLMDVWFDTLPWHYGVYGLDEPICMARKVDFHVLSEYTLRTIIGGIESQSQGAPSGCSGAGIDFTIGPLPSGRYKVEMPAGWNIGL